MNIEKPIVENVVITDGENERTFVHCPENLEGEYIIPDGVTAIAPLAFKNCSQLESIVIPNSVRHIGHHAFEGCTAIKEVQIFTSEVTIGKAVFSGCKSLKKIIASSIAAIWPFLSTRERKGVDFEPMELDQMGFEDEVLQDLYSSDGTVLIRCSKRTTRYSIPNGVEEIAKNAFAGCALLEGVSIPKTITRIGDGAFSGCEQITSILLPDSIVSIGQNAFYGCKALNGIYIPNGSRDKFEKLLPKHLHDRLIELKAIHDKH